MSVMIEYYCISHPGLLRDINQDNFFCRGEYLPSDNNGTSGMIHGNAPSDASSVFAVFDGIGGGTRGEMAAYIAAQDLDTYELCGKPSDALVGFCRDANGKICDYGKENGIRNIGSTCAMVLAERKKLHICNIGDSKVMRCSKGKFTVLSKDHVSGLPSGAKPALSQHLGIPESEFLIMPHTEKCSYRKGDIYVICSDGLTDMVSFDEISLILSQNDGADAAQILLDTALANGGRDNITFILLYITE